MNGSQANFAPVPSMAASRMRTTASVTSGPMPSPASSVMVCVLSCGPAAILPPWLSFAGLGRFPGVEQLFELFLELAYVFKVPVNTGKADVGDLIDGPQMVHDQLADLVGRSFAFRRIHQERLGLVHDRFQFGGGDGTLFAGPQQAAQHFLPLEFFPAAVFFHHHVRDFVDALIGSKSLVTTLAFPTAAKRVRLFAFSRIHHSILRKSAVRAFHQ